MNTERIFMLMKSHNIQQKDFAKEIQVLPSVLSDWKSGRLKPSIEIISKIADYFNVSTDYLLGKTDITSIPEELKEVNAAFLDKAFQGLDEKDIDLLKQMALRLKEQKNK